jgi:hypothetical protein
MIRRFLLLLILILTACNAQTPATDSPFFTATPNPIFEPPLQNQSLAGTSVPAEFSGGNPVLLANQAPFEFAVSGDVVSQVSAGSIVYNFIPGTSGIPAHDQLYLSSSDSRSSQQITIQFSSGIPIGDYRLSSPREFVLGAVSAQYARLSDDGSGSQLRTYAEDVMGRINLTAVGDRLSGEFQFTANHTEEDGTRSQLEVAGNFSNVPYNRSGNPFEIAVPLPIRGVTGTEEP